MATITAFTKEVIAPGKYKYTSAVATIAPNDKVLLTGLDGVFRHIAIGIHQFDVSGDRVVGGAGTYTVDYLTEHTGISTVGATFEDPSSAVITAATPVTLEFTAAGVTGIQVVEAGVTTALTWQAVITVNES